MCVNHLCDSGDHLTVEPVTYLVFCRRILNLTCILTKCTSGLQAAQWKKTPSFHVSGNSIRDILERKLTLLMLVHSFWKVNFYNCMLSLILLMYKKYTKKKNPNPIQFYSFIF